MVQFDAKLGNSKAFTGFHHVRSSLAQLISALSALSLEDSGWRSSPGPLCFLWVFCPLSVHIMRFASLCACVNNFIFVWVLPLFGIQVSTHCPYTCSLVWLNCCFWNNFLYQYFWVQMLYFFFLTASDKLLLCSVLKQSSWNSLAGRSNILKHIRGKPLWIRASSGNHAEPTGSLSLNDRWKRLLETFSQTLTYVSSFILVLKLIIRAENHGVPHDTWITI